jgi:hypothetical protein
LLGVAISRHLAQGQRPANRGHGRHEQLLGHVLLLPSADVREWA